MLKSIAIIVNFEKEQAPKFITRFNNVLLPMKERIQWEFIHYTDLIDPEQQKHFMSMDGVILTGSYSMLSDSIVFKKFFPIITLIPRFSKSILGICFGHQLIGRAFGFQIQDLPPAVYNSEYETVIQLHLKSPFELISKSDIAVSVSHHQEIRYTSEFDNIFKIYASSRACKIHIIKHRELPIYGLQFHPENDENSQVFQEGKAIFRNFVSIVEG